MYGTERFFFDFPNLYILLSPVCWRSTRVSAMRFMTTLVNNQPGMADVMCFLISSVLKLTILISLLLLSEVKLKFC